MGKIPQNAVLTALLFSGQNSGTGFNLQSGSAPSVQEQHFCKIPGGGTSGGANILKEVLCLLRMKAAT
jgi:hypothetical protein